VSPTHSSERLDADPRCSFALLESYLEEQAAVAFASSHTVSGKTNAASSETAAKPGVKRKGSGQGSRGVEVSVQAAIRVRIGY
jgi:hypothetical protein